MQTAPLLNVRYHIDHSACAGISSLRGCYIFMCIVTGVCIVTRNDDNIRLRRPSVDHAKLGLTMSCDVGR